MARVKRRRTIDRAGPWLDRYINRELSWLEFNRRVLSEAQNESNPLLERLKFLAIFESNLDEFYMVRVSGLIEQFEGGFSELTPDGLKPDEQLRLVFERSVPMRQEAGKCFQESIVPALGENGVSIKRYAQLSERQRGEMESFFLREVFPVCTPLILHPTNSVPFISNRSVNLAVELGSRVGETRLARVKVPSILDRIVRVPGRRNDFVFLEDVIASNLDFLFPGVQVLGAYPFRVLRDADIEIRELEAADLITAVEEMTRKRRFGDPVRIDVQPSMPAEVHARLLNILELDNTDVFLCEGTLGLECLWELAGLDRPQLKYRPFVPYSNESLSEPRKLFDVIRQGDVLVHQPFDSFDSVQAFVDSAADEPNVIGIKQTLYRVGSESPIVESLLEAAEYGKQVAVMVELKARFDESNNLIWARALERAGVHVSFGFSDLKTHCKLCLIVRREADGIRSYAHVGTGNYNPITARIYTDFGLFTDDPEITQDIAELFNFLTGFSNQSEYRKLLVAPLNLREGILDRIEREREIHLKSGTGRIIFKLNSLVDPEAIDALYEAAEVGVEIDLIVRGICCLRPGIEGLSKNIRVTSIVGRFLEHSRAFYFGGGGNPELFIGSADLMRRNLDRRIEVLAPVQGISMIEQLKSDVLDVCLKDTVNSWRLQSDGTYRKRLPSKGESAFSAHDWLLQNPMSKSIVQRLNADRPNS